MFSSVLRRLRSCSASRPGGSRLRYVAVAALAGMAISAASAPAASAASKYKSCEAGGFIGTVRIDYYQPTFGVFAYNEISARIDKRSQRSGGYGYSAVTDNGVLPTRTYRGAITQNNSWHVLYSGPARTTSTNGFAIYFKFNKAFALDPSCSAYLRL